MNVTNSTDVFTGIKGVIESTKEVVPYEAWMGVALILGILVILCKVPFISGIAKTFMYLLIVAIAIVFLVILGYINF